MAAPAEAMPTATPATAGPTAWPIGGSDHALEAVDREQVLLGHQRRQPGGVRREVERHRRADREPDDGELPELGQVGERQHGHERHAGQLDGGDDDQDQLLRDPVGDHAAEQRRQQHPDRTGGRDDGQLGGTAAHPDDLPDQADHPDAAGERRQHQRDRQPPVRRVAERRQRARQPTRLGLVPRGPTSVIASSAPVWDRQRPPNSTHHEGDNREREPTQSDAETGRRRERQTEAWRRRRHGDVATGRRPGRSGGARTRARAASGTAPPRG